MTTKVEKCPTCGSDAVDRSDYWEACVPESDQMSQTMHKIEHAIKQYHLDLDNRKHGGQSQDKAFRIICEALGMHWEQGKMKEHLENKPALQKLFDL